MSASYENSGLKLLWVVAGAAVQQDQRRFAALAAAIGPRPAPSMSTKRRRPGAIEIFLVRQVRPTGLQQAEPAQRGRELAGLGACRRRRIALLAQQRHKSLEVAAVAFAPVAREQLQPERF